MRPLRRSQIGWEFHRVKLRRLKALKRRAFLEDFLALFIFVNSKDINRYAWLLGCKLHFFLPHLGAKLSERSFPLRTNSKGVSRYLLLHLLRRIVTTDTNEEELFVSSTLIYKCFISSLRNGRYRRVQVNEYIVSKCACFRKICNQTCDMTFCVHDCERFQSTKKSMTFSKFFKLYSKGHRDVIRMSCNTECMCCALLYLTLLVLERIILYALQHFSKKY